MEEIGVLIDHRDLAADVREAEVAKVPAADLHGPLAWVVEAQQQAHDGGLADPARADETDPLTRLHLEAQAFVGGAATARIGEAHVLESDARAQRADGADARFLGDDGARIQQMEDRLRRGLRHHAVVHQRAHVAERPEDFDAQHQNHDQRREAHLAVGHPEGAERQGRRRPHRDPRVGDPARQRIGRQHPHGGAEQVVGLRLQGLGARAALPEGLQGREPLDGIEEFCGEGLVGARAAQTVVLVPGMENLRRDQRHQGRGQHDQRHRQIEENHDAEDQERRERRDDQLRQVLAEINLQLLDPVDHRQNGVAGTLQPEMRRAQLRDLVEDHRAQMHLHPGGGVVRHHGTQILEPAARHHDGGDAGEGQDQRVERNALEDLRDQPAEEGQPRDAEQHRQNADGDRAEDPRPHPLGVAPEP